MKRVAEFRAKLAKVATDMRAVLAAAQQEGGEDWDGRVSADQQKTYDGLVALKATLEAAIAREEAVDDADRRATPVTTLAGDGSRGRVGSPRSESDLAARGFQSHKDFLTAVRDNADARQPADLSDERLAILMEPSGDKGAQGTFMLPNAFSPPAMRAAVGSDEQNTSQDSYGGYAVPTVLRPGMLSVDPDADPSVGRVMAVPMAASTVEILARTDKNHTSSVTGGLAVGRRAEMATFASSRMQMEKVTLKAAMLAGLNYETEELLSDSLISFIALIEAGFRTEFPSRKFKEKLRGLGGDEYIGVLTALAASGLGPTVSVAKESGQAADTILAQNVIKMRARCWGYSNAIWIGNHDAYPQVRTMSVAVGVAGQLVYQPSLIEGRPDTLEGRPIFYSEYASTVGDQGDLILANWSQFLEGVYQPLQNASSVHVRFETHERTFKFWERNAGAPWWKVALTPHKGANSLSPFVVLDARA